MDITSFSSNDPLTVVLESEVSSVFSDEAEDETLFDRISALKDVIPPKQRRYIASTANTAQSWGWWGLSSAAKLSWTIGVSAILLAIPFAVGSTEDAQLALEEKQLSMQQGQNEVCWQLLSVARSVRYH